MFTVIEQFFGSATMIGVDCSYLSIKVYISNNSFSSFNNFKKLYKKDLTSLVDAFSLQGLIFTWCWTSMAHGSLRSGILAVPFLCLSVFEHEIAISQKSLQAYRNVSFSFCRSKVGDLIVNFLTHSAVGFFTLSSQAPSFVSPLHVMTLRFWCGVWFSAPTNWMFLFLSCGLFSYHLLCKIGQSSIICS